MEKSNFKVGFRVREVSQWLDLDITLQMAFRRARGDFSRPETGTGIMDPRYLECLREPRLMLLKDKMPADRSDGVYGDER